MLYTQNLEEIIFHRHEMLDVDELIVVSGYLGPKPVARLENLPLNSKVIYGMYGSDGIQTNLHHSLIGIQNSAEKINIFYSNIPVHSKCYLWRKKGEIKHALLGSANFSINGLTTPYREVLAETTFDTFEPLNQYVELITNNSISCLEAVLSVAQPQKSNANLKVCSSSLLDANEEVQNAAGLNWGQNPTNHTNENDAYIAIRTSHIRDCPNLFPPKQLQPSIISEEGRIQRHNDAIEIIWDDGLVMQGLLEGSQPIDGVKYPKQISSFPSKAELGIYIRERLNVPLGQPVRAHHLKSYGRTDIKISLIEEGVYNFDFSV